MHILFCNERFLFRYGVDRVLLVLADYLRKRGDTVSIMGINIDMKVAETVADHIIRIPSNDDYYYINEHVDTWLKDNWDELFADTGSPDLVLNCGWPFFVSIPFMQTKTKGVIFHDYGIVPVYQYQYGTLKIQEKVRSLRREYMPFCSYVITISDYVTQTTYEIKPQHNIPVKTIHLGTDHMQMNLWNPDQLRNAADAGTAAKMIQRFRDEGKQIILNLGRWENIGYKNSLMMYNIMREILKRRRNTVLLTLADPKDIKIPTELQHAIFPMGFISDSDLVYAMQEADLGIAPTLWEGFNLPLAEMQYCEKPVLVFNVGAHPEVVIHPWYLCNDGNEMVDKACLVLEGRDLPQEIKHSAYERFKAYFTWENCAKKCCEVFEYVLHNKKYDILEDDEFTANAAKTETIIMDMTNPAHDPANPGIIRVCRRLAAEMQKYVDPIFVIWSEPDKAYVLPTAEEYRVMGTYHGPILFDHMRISPDAYRVQLTDYLKTRTPKKIKWLFLPDIIFMEHGEDVRRFCRANGFSMAEIFYDDIPYKLDDIYDHDRQDAHAKYMLRMADSEFVSSISQYSTDCLKAFYQKVGVTNSNVLTIELPGEFNSIKRVTEKRIPREDIVQFLCVSTLEPRKNHIPLIKACTLLEQKHPELEFRLVMIGNKYAGHFDIAEYAERVSKEHKSVQYRGVVSDEVMEKELRRSTFTVYPSKMEGYGMPIVESLWQGKPCLCSGEGAMGEIARGGGCYTTDVNSPEALAEALYALCTDRKLVERLTEEAITREMITWKEYTEKTLRQFVLEERRLMGQTIPDRRFAAWYRCDRVISPVVSMLREFSSSDSAVSVTTVGIDNADLLRCIDEKADLTIAYTKVTWDLKEKYHNTILINSLYSGLESLAEAQSSVCPHSYKLVIDASNIEKAEWNTVKKEHLYEEILILNCSRKLRIPGYRTTELAEKTLYLWRIAET